MGLNYYPSGSRGEVLLGSKHINGIGDSLNHRGLVTCKMYLLPLSIKAGTVQVGIHHRAVALGSSSVMDATVGSFNHDGKDLSRTCGDVTTSDNSWCHGRTLYISWSTSFLGWWPWCHEGTCLGTGHPGYAHGY